MERERHFTRDASHELRSPSHRVRDGLRPAAAGIRTPRTRTRRRAVTRISRSARDMEELTGLPSCCSRVNRKRDCRPRLVVHQRRNRQLNSNACCRSQKAGPSCRAATDCNRLPPVAHSSGKVCWSVLLGNLLRNAVRLHRRRTGSSRRNPSRRCRDPRTPASACWPARLHNMDQPFVRGRLRAVGIRLRRRTGPSCGWLSDRFGWPVEFTSQAGVGTRVRCHIPRGHGGHTPRGLTRRGPPSRLEGVVFALR